MREHKINILRDNPDYEKELTKDEIVNVIGNKGSGKTTSSLKYINDDNYIVVNCDRLFELPGGEEDKELPKIRSMLKKKYGKLKNETFLNYYNDIIDYIYSQNKKVFI